MTVLEGQITDFVSYTLFEITKTLHRKITKKWHAEGRELQINEKLLKNHKKRSLRITKITNKLQKKNYVILKSQESRTLF